MGDGVILEQGKHEELLHNDDGHYTRLVTAQRLREAREVIDIDDADVIEQGSDQVEDVIDIEKQILEENPLDRNKSQQSLASEIIEQRRAQNAGKRETQYSMFYLFKRMGKINKAAWKFYLFGTLFSIGTSGCLFAGIISIADRPLQQRDASFRPSVSFGVRKT
jgi:ATP-binding cassette subfamily B (MDR/TAP) protein 1